MFTFGSNHYGKLGAGEPELESESESSSEPEEQEDDSSDDELSPPKNPSTHLKVPPVAEAHKRNSQSIVRINREPKIRTDPISAAHLKNSTKIDGKSRPRGSVFNNLGAAPIPDIGGDQAGGPLLRIPKDEWQTVPKMIQNFVPPGERVTSVQCGSGHTLAITQRGSVYSWGEGFEGKLGLGYSSSMRMCENQAHPKKVTKGLIDNGQAARGDKDPIQSAACGKSISIAVMLRGRAFMWGKGEYHRVKFDDLKQYSRPFPICQDIKIM